MQSEITYTRKPLIHGNSCKVNALFNKGAHPRPRFFEESSVHLKISKTTGKTKETKEVKAKINKNHRENQQKQNFRPMSAKVDMGPKVLFVLFCFVVPMVFDSFCLDLFGCFGFFGFPDGF